MRFDELFEMRKLTGTKLKNYIRSNGFSKVSFCKKTEISRPTLDKILNGEIDSKSTFDKHLNKILTSLSIDPDTLMGFSPRVQSVDAVYSQNTVPHAAFLGALQHGLDFLNAPGRGCGFDGVRHGLPQFGRQGLPFSAQGSSLPFHSR